MISSPAEGETKSATKEKPITNTTNAVYSYGVV